ncbi:MAG: hypothetical protein IK080_08915 [Clostridia bacterium]|nr:hypothetical protein [Clostridia bacterium]
MAEKNEFLMYKERPLVRSGKTIYYGYMSEKCVIVIQITSTKEVNGMEVADRVKVQLISTDPTLRMKDRILNTAERRGLYSAMDLGAIWLERELKNA